MTANARRRRCLPRADEERFGTFRCLPRGGEEQVGRPSGEANIEGGLAGVEICFSSSDFISVTEEITMVYQIKNRMSVYC